MCRVGNAADGIIGTVRGVYGPVATVTAATARA
jgi:hypothetical protein